MKIRLLPYDSCVKIGKQAFTTEQTIAGVFGLDPDIFDRTFNVVEMLSDDEGSFYHIKEEVTRLIDGEYRDFLFDWWVPAIFVSYVSR